MKKINLKRLSSILSEKELKNVLGGSGGGDCCAHSAFGFLTCVGSASEAEWKAGSSGWWACNSQEVKNHCGC